jgi:uncharacterized protein (TIGR00255 family)
LSVSAADFVPGTLCSMTGFARAGGALGTVSWGLEIKSVNGKSLEIRCKLPPGFDSVEARIRTELARVLKRGNVNVSLTMTRHETAGRVRLNRALLNEIRQLAREFDGPDAPPMRLEALLGVRGILEFDESDSADQDPQALEASLTAGVIDAVTALAQARADEGHHLAQILTAQLDSIHGLIDRAAGLSCTQPETLRSRLRTQVRELLDSFPALPEERLAQEAALLIAKADVREELDRLNAHVGQARTLLAEGGAIGRRLDFLCQEFNREANTLCSKSADVELTRIGLDLKATIEQFREQIQNLE